MAKYCIEKYLLLAMLGALSVLRAMTFPDLQGVASVTDAAFAALHSPGDRADPAACAIPPLLVRTRLTADPAGCFVAVSEQDPGWVTGALLPVTRLPQVRVGLAGAAVPLVAAADRRGRDESPRLACDEL